MDIYLLLEEFNRQEYDIHLASCEENYDKDQIFFEGIANDKNLYFSYSTKDKSIHIYSDNKYKDKRSKLNIKDFDLLYILAKCLNPSFFEEEPEVSIVDTAASINSEIKQIKEEFGDLVIVDDSEVED